MNIELLKSRISELLGNVTDLIWSMKLDEEQVQDTIDKVYDIYDFYTENNIPYEYGLEGMIDEIIKGYLKNNTEITEIITEVEDLIEEADELHMELVELEEDEDDEELIEILEVLKECKENLDFDSYDIDELDDYIDNLQTVEEILEKI